MLQKIDHFVISELRWTHKYFWKDFLGPWRLEKRCSCFDANLDNEYIKTTSFLYHVWWYDIWTAPRWNLSYKKDCSFITYNSSHITLSLTLRLLWKDFIRRQLFRIWIKPNFWFLKNWPCHSSSPLSGLYLLLILSEEVGLPSQAFSFPQYTRQQYTLFEKYDFR